MSQYEQIVALLKADIRAAWGSDFKISCGRPKVAFDSAPYAVISLDGGVSSQGSGRNLIRTWRFTIIGLFEFDGDQDSEGLAMAKAEAFMQEFEPFDDAVVPSVDTHYDSVADQHFVVSWSPMEEQVEDDFVGVSITVEIQTHVYA